MPDFNLYANVGPVFRAESEIETPVVGATPRFLITVTRDGIPVNDATVTLKILSETGVTVYPLSGTGTQTVPRLAKYPGTYAIVPASAAIFTTSDAYYSVVWNISTEANTEYPACVLPMTQKVLPVEP